MPATLALPSRGRAIAVAFVTSLGLAAFSTPFSSDAAQADESKGAAKVTVARVSGKPVAADAWIGVKDAKLQLKVSDGGSVSVPIEDVIEVSLGNEPDPAGGLSAEAVYLDLWSGEEIRGRIVAGDDYGLTINNPLLGDVRVDVDAVAGLRFPHRLAQLAEPPEMDPSEDADIIHLAGGDRIDCTVAAFGVEALSCSTASDDDLSVAYDRVTAVRLMPTGEEAPSGAALTAVLRDGSRLAGSEPTVADGRLRIRSLSGFEAEAALDDVVSVLMISDKFKYLSDLPAPEVAVKPFWDLVAGDPAEIYAPRMDRAFSGGLLTSNGRTWLRGIGVYSGTTLTFDLGEGWSEFRTQVAVDDRAGPLGGVVFVVEVDGKERWRSDLVTPAIEGGKGGPVTVPSIDVKGAGQLVLRVLPGTKSDPYPIQDEADWLGAMLVR